MIFTQSSFRGGDYPIVHHIAPRTTATKGLERLSGSALFVTKYIFSIETASVAEVDGPCALEGAHVWVGLVARRVGQVAPPRGALGDMGAL